MLKVKKSEIENNDTFVFAKKFLKSQIENIASSFKSENDVNLEDKANNHFKMVARIAKMYMNILESFTENDLKKLNNTSDNIKILNKFLALRQLTETQLHGVLQGTWGIPPNITNSEEFKTAISNSVCDLSREQIWNEVTK